MQIQKYKNTRQIGRFYLLFDVLLQDDVILQFLMKQGSINHVLMFYFILIKRWQLVSFCLEADLSDVLLHDDALMHCNLRQRKDKLYFIYIIDWRTSTIIAF